MSAYREYQIQFVITDIQNNFGKTITKEHIADVNACIRHTEEAAEILQMTISDVLITPMDYLKEQRD